MTVGAVQSSGFRGSEFRALELRVQSLGFRSSGLRAWVSRGDPSTSKSGKRLVLRRKARP